jgi:hypothetical protein
MANNYLQFSEVLPRLTAEEEAWLRAQLRCVAVLDGTETEIADCDDETTEGAEWVGPRFLRDEEDYDPDCGLSFEFEFDDDHGEWGRHLWVYAEESGEPGNVAWLVRKFLKQFRPHQCWSLAWAETCSKLRVGEFYGGAVFVTSEDIKWQSAYQFVKQERATFEARQSAAQDVVAVESAADAKERGTAETPAVSADDPQLLDAPVKAEVEATRHDDG